VAIDRRETEPRPAAGGPAGGPGPWTPDAAADGPEPAVGATAATPRRRHARVGRVRQGWRGLPPLLRAILLLHGLLLVASTIFYPNYRGPDEPLHVDLIAATVQGDTVPWPAPGTRRVSSGVSAGSYFTNGRIAESAVHAAGDAPPRSDRPSYADRGGETPVKAPNQLVQHPPAFYWLMAPALAIVPNWENQPFDRIVVWLRVVNSLFLLPMPLLIFLLARRVGLTEPVSTAAAAVMLAVPQFYHTGSAVNNDNLMIPLMVGASLLAAIVARGDLRYRTAIGLGLISGACLLTKGFALFLPLLIALAYLVAATRRGLLRSIPPGIVAGAVAIGSGGWWWIHNKIAYGVTQPDGTRTVQPKFNRHTTFEETGTRWMKIFAHLMNRRFWVDPGAQQMPSVVEWVGLAGAGLLAVAILVTFVVGSPARRDSVLLAVPFLCLLGVVAWGSWKTWLIAVQPAGVQGRYLYGGLAGLAVLAVGGIGRFAGRRLVVVVLGLALVVQVINMYLLLRVYWLPPTGSVPGRLVQSLRNMVAWSPWPPVLALPLFAALAAAAGWTAWRAIQSQRGPTHTETPELVPAH
jgi:4-amino-4-deoxy-L-arabinose transferase-like glycosyltransferase